MCGRFVLIAPVDEIETTFGSVGRPNLMPRYNIAPTTPVVAIVGAERRLTFLRWGFIPSWVKDPAAFTLLINARLETIEEKPSFRHAFKRRRCVIPADGFFEWHRAGADKQAHYVTLSDGGLIAMAGIWETWCGPDGEEMDSVALITQPANDDMRAIHHRMPLILTKDRLDIWLDPGLERSSQLMPAFDDRERGLLTCQMVSNRVNSVRNEGPDLVERVCEKSLDCCDENACVNKTRKHFDHTINIGNAPPTGELATPAEPEIADGDRQLKLI